MNIFQRIVRKLGIVLRLNYVGIYQNKFKLDGGDNLRYLYQLKDAATIFDLGAFEGEFISNIYRPGYKIYAFEINSEKIHLLKDKFSKLAKINGFGLGSEELRGCNVNNGPGNYLKMTDSGDILIKKFDEYCSEQGILEIDLLKINIEGAEFDLVKYLDQIGYISRVNYIQIQPHDFVENSMDKLLEMHRILNKTHDLQKSYPFVWDFWARRT
jgi:FkbM family methyltransferase